MMRRLPILSAVLAPLGCALLGCDGGPSSVLIDVRVENPYQFLRWAQLQGPMLMEIHGQPFAGTARFQPAEFVAAVQGSTKRPTETGDRNWRRLIRRMSRQLVGDRLTG